MTETKNADGESATRPNSNQNYDPTLDRYLAIDNEQIIKILRKAKVEIRYKGTGHILAGIKQQMDMVINDEGSVRLPNKKFAKNSMITNTSTWKFKIQQTVVTNDRILFLYKNGEGFIPMNAISLVYNAEAKPLLMDLYKENKEHRDDLKAAIEAGDKSAKKELKEVQGISFGSGWKGRMRARSNDLKGWWELKDVNMDGKEVQLQLNWNTAPHMEAAGISTLEAMKATMGAPYPNVNPLSVTFKLKPKDAEELYTILRRGIQ
ncbi:MAG: hypothetical protein ACP5MZ_02130 [Candidatus Micrarchaeia archaeon]